MIKVLEKGGFRFSVDTTGRVQVAFHVRCTGNYEDWDEGIYLEPDDLRQVLIAAHSYRPAGTRSHLD